MKRIVFFIAVLCGTLFFKQAHAQVSYELNISRQPLWGPSGFPHVDYYYLPDIECYYDVPRHVFLYQVGKKWERSPSLPPKYKNYDLYKGYKVVVNQPSPYLMHDSYRKSSLKYKGVKGQLTLRDVSVKKFTPVHVPNPLVKSPPHGKVKAGKPLPKHKPAPQSRPRDQ